MSSSTATTSTTTTRRTSAAGSCPTWRTSSQVILVTWTRPLSRYLKETIGEFWISAQNIRKLFMKDFLEFLKWGNRIKRPLTPGKFFVTTQKKSSKLEQKLFVTLCLVFYVFYNSLFTVHVTSCQIQDPGKATIRHLFLLKVNGLTHSHLGIHICAKAAQS